jgi:hypothetical protein
MIYLYIYIYIYIYYVIQQSLNNTLLLKRKVLFQFHVPYEPKLNFRHRILMKLQIQ